MPTRQPPAADIDKEPGAEMPGSLLLAFGEIAI